MAEDKARIDLKALETVTRKVLAYGPKPQAKRRRGKRPAPDTSDAAR